MKILSLLFPGTKAQVFAKILHSNSMDLSIQVDFCELVRLRFNLTPTEIRICELLTRGNTRPDLKRLLGINENCLKWHLKQIYAKTIGDSPKEHDKLHRLTQLLHRIQMAKNYT